MARILVVDDKPQNLSLIEMYLRGTEFEVVAVTSGYEAIEHSMKQAFDVLRQLRACGLPVHAWP